MRLSLTADKRLKGRQALKTFQGLSLSLERSGMTAMFPGTKMDPIPLVLLGGKSVFCIQFWLKKVFPCSFALYWNASY